ncbi:MAG: Holliday junction resolvase RuvX [Lachnospiraceae bacterium]|nr:Holliday junction resolvase RuvX [Lachnospiraceae bacterium]
MRLLGLDYGSKTVGVAVSDELGLTAQGVETILRDAENKLRRTYQRLEALAAELHVGQIVVGYPLNMDDSEGERALRTREFGSALGRRTGLPVVYWDERLTTVEASQILKESGVAGKDQKRVIDQLAAMLILQSYMDAHGA